MSTSRTALRVALAALAVGVTVLVAWQWRRPEPGPVAGEPPPDAAGGLVSRTAGLDYTHTVDGRPRYRVRARENLGFSGGRSEWRGGVELILYPSEGDPAAEPTVITGERMWTLRSNGGYERVRIGGRVRAQLPDRAEVRARSLVYEDASGQVSSDSGVELRHAGLVARARSLRYDTHTRWLRLWDNLRLLGDAAADDAAVADAAGRLRGRATELLFGPDLGGVVLGGAPTLKVGEAALLGERLHLLVDKEGRLGAVEAEGEARATLAGDGQDHLLRAEALRLELGADGAARRLLGETVAGIRPHLRVAGAGALEAAEIALEMGPGGAARVEAGEAAWRPSAAGRGLQALAGASLSLEVVGGSPAAATAEGGVRLRLPAAAGAGTLAGERLELGWEEGSLRRGRWSGGLSYEGKGRSLVAAGGSYDPAAGAWLLEGPPRPRLQEEGLVLEADRVWLGTDASVRAAGGVRGRLRGSGVESVAPLFGDVGAVEAGAAEVAVEESGRLVLRDPAGARLWQGDRFVVAEEIVLEPEPPAVRAGGDVLVALQEAPGADAGGPDDEEGAGGPGTLQAAGERLLMEAQPPRLRLVGDIELQQGRRRIFGSSLTVVFDGQGGWRSIEVEGSVRMEDEAGSGEGDRLLLASRDRITLYGSSERPASFTDLRGMEIRDPLALRFDWGEAGLVVTALQQGRTRTLPVPGSAAPSAAPGRP